MKLSYLSALFLLIFMGASCQQPTTVNAPSASTEETSVNSEQSTSTSDTQEDVTDESGQAEDTDASPENTVDSVYALYEGAYFDIEYPSGFSIEEREESSSFQGKYDGVAFVSSDKEVEFYIWSPLWGGESLYEKTAENEEEVAEQINVSGEEFARKETTLRTVEAKDGSYARSMRIISEQEGSVRYLFGIQYASPTALENARDAYNHFRSSLIQYADA